MRPSNLRIRVGPMERLSKPVSVRVCVLYDPHDGRVVHTHRVLCMQGGRESTDEEIEANCKDAAKRAGHNVSEVSLMHIAGEHYERNARYRVDMATKKLQKLERSAPDRGHPTSR
jgi:hypothetical protein